MEGRIEELRIDLATFSNVSIKDIFKTFDIGRRNWVCAIDIQDIMFELKMNASPDAIQLFMK
jgi:hypothetical protein